MITLNQIIGTQFAILPYVPVPYNSTGFELFFM